MTIFIGGENVSGIKAINKKDLIAYISELYDEAVQRGDNAIDIDFKSYKES